IHAARQQIGSFAVYLLYPRPVDLIKWVFVPLSVVLFAALSSPPFHWSWRTVGVVALASFIFEGLIYAARYQVNDVRDYAHDVAHSTADYRGRLPRGQTDAERRGIILTSLGVAGYRLVLAFALVAIVAPGEIGWTLIVFAMVVVSTAVYELAKQRARAPNGAGVPRPATVELGGRRRAAA